MRYIIYDTQQQAADAAQLCYDAALPLYQAQGYTITQAGIVDRINGVDMPQNAKTNAWDIPKQRLDGKWIISHPENHTSAGLEVAPGITALDVILSKLGAVVAENFTPTWFEQVNL